MPQNALSHLTVLDLTHYIAGPYCTKLMAGFGANVLKIERPDAGDGLRGVGPFFRGRENPETGIPFLWLNTGKKSLTLNLKTERGLEIFKSLLRGADVVVENFSPRVMPSLGLSYGELREINPRIIMTSISNFGQTGPYRDYRATEIVEYALSGLMYLTGDPDKAPLSSGPAMTQYTAGMTAYISTLMALFARGMKGTGQYVDVSIHESGLDNVEVAIAEYLHMGKVARRAADEHTLVPWQIHPCADGYAAIIGGPIRHWLRGADLFEEPRLLDKRYEHMIDRMKHREEVKALMRPWLMRNRKKDIFHAGQAKKMAFSYLASLDEALESPQHLARDYFQEIEHPVAGKHKYCGPPFRPSEARWQQEPAPLLGEHNEEIYRHALGYSPEALEAMREEGVI